MNERRKSGGNAPAGLTKSTSLPVDYLRMVQEVFTTTFAEGLKALKSQDSKPRIEVSGDIYADEIVLLGISLSKRNRIWREPSHRNIA